MKIYFNDLTAWILLPLVSGGIGWITNYLAIKMLFHPRKPRHLFFITLQGVFPKRKSLLADKIGKLVAEQLLSTAQLKQYIDTVETRQEIKRAILKEIEEMILKFKAQNPMVGMFLSEAIVAQLGEKISNYLDESLPSIIGKISNKLDSIDIQQIVAQKVRDFSNEELEKVLMNVINRELKFIERTGGVLGFLIGILQMLILYIIR
ncbi:MAG: DUF445 family protein [Cytophagales bacterium]|nr:DUF445 family protein [Cytophagales bacterium]MDW8383722.1 DUF445 family protein [Flammeovirgaceae bacterium]